MNYKVFLWAVFTTSLLVLIAGWVYKEEAIAPIIKEVEAEETKEEIIVEKTTPLPSLLEKIALCESGGVHFTKEGSVVRGLVNNQDIGKYQINLRYHGERAKELGIDLFTEKGNEDYARLLFKEEGSTPWNASRSCWLSTGSSTIK